MTYRHNHTHRLSSVWLKAYNHTDKLASVQLEAYNHTNKLASVRLGFKRRETLSSQTKTSCRSATSDICLFTSENFNNKEFSIHPMQMKMDVGILWRVSPSKWEDPLVIIIQNINLSIIILSCINGTIRSWNQAISVSRIYIHNRHDMLTSTTSSSYMNMTSKFH